MTTTNTAVAQHKLSVETCVKHLGQSMILGRKAILQELSVCVAIFAGAGNVAAKTKQMVVDVYKQAGYDADNKKSRHYKTVNRRVNASAGLYSKLGAKTIAKWVGDAQEDSMLMAISKGLEEHKFDSMDDVLQFVGQPNNRTSKKVNTAPKAERPIKAKKEPVPMQVFRVPGVKVEVPQNLSSEAMLKLAAKIIDAARKKEQDELAHSTGHLSEVKAPMVVSTVH